MEESKPTKKGGKKWLVRIVGEDFSPNAPPW
jgi:hypothetical protein